jgi:hypothetical protein
MKLKVQDSPNYVRDSNTQAIINVDTESYNIALRRRKKNTEQQEKITELTQQLDELIAWKKQIEEMLDEKLNK